MPVCVIDVPDSVVTTPGAYVRARGCTINADGCTIESDDCIISGDGCFVFGDRCVVNGDDCFVFGRHCVVNGERATVYGDDCTLSNATSALYTLAATAERARADGAHALRLGRRLRRRERASPLAACPVHSAPTHIAEPGELSCRRCEINTVDTMLRPCGHASLCGACARIVLSSKRECPVCNARVRTATVVYL
jgi:hypothetical protein